MAVITILSRLVNGVQRNVDLSANTLKVDVLQALTKVRLGDDVTYTDVNKTGYDALVSHVASTSNPHSVTKAQVGLTNVTDNAQVKGLASGTTSGNLVAFGADGYTVADSGSSPSSFEPANANIQTHISSTSNPHGVTKTQVGLSNVTNDAQLALIGGTLSGFLTLHADPTSAMHAATRQYVLSQVAASGTSAEWQASVFDRLATPPGSPSSGDRYLVIATATGDWEGHENEIAQWSGTAWTFTVCTAGTFVSVDDETDGIYYFGGSSWTKKQWERNTAGSGIAIDGNGVVSASGISNSNIASDAAIVWSKLSVASGDIALAKLAAGTPGQIIVAAETSGIPTYVSMSGDITIGTTGVTAIGTGKVTNDMLAGSIADSKLSQITTASKVAGSAIQLGSNPGLQDSTGLIVKLDTNSGLALGAGGLSVVHPAQKSFLAGESFAADTSFIVRMAITGETAGRVYKVTNDTTTSDLFYAIGYVSPTASVAAGDAIIVQSFGSMTLGSSDTAFNAADVGKPIYITTAGAFSITVPSAGKAAIVQVGVVQETSKVWIQPMRIMGVNE